MKAVVYDAPGKFAVREVDTPTPTPSQVLIRLRACGVCRTDLHIHEGDFISRFPLTPGHEFCGEVAAIGDGVSRFKVGDRVCADNTILCGKCFYCQRNQPLYCENFYSLGVTGPGGFAEYVVVEEAKTFPLGDLSWLEGCMVEPTACAVHGVEQIGVRTGDVMVVYGAGPTGLVLLQLLRVHGASALVVADPNPGKLELAEDLGADHTVLVNRDNHEETVTALRKAEPGGFDVIVDAAGVPANVESAPRLARMGAKIVCYGVCDKDDSIRLSPYDIFQRELRILGSFAQTHRFGAALDFLHTGRVRADRLVTHTFGLEEYGQALAAMREIREKGKLAICMG